MEGLCILLRRLAYPCRFGDMVPRFGKPVPVLSMVSNTVIDYIYSIHGHRITRWNDQLVNPLALDTYARSVHANRAALQNCFGFVDGTVRPIARPDERQRMMYNGHKRVHAIKFQSVALPNELIANLYGPVGKDLFDLLLFINRCQVCETETNGKGTNMVLEGSCFPLQVCFTV